MSHCSVFEDQIKCFSSVISMPETYHIVFADWLTLCMMHYALCIFTSSHKMFNSLLAHLYLKVIGGKISHRCRSIAVAGLAMKNPHLAENPLICTALKLKTNLDVAEVSKLVNLDLAINKDPRVMDEEGDDDAVNR